MGHSSKMMVRAECQNLSQAARVQETGDFAEAHKMQNPSFVTASHKV